MEKYKRLGRLGEGAHGVVFKAELLQEVDQTPRKRKDRPTDSFLSAPSTASSSSPTTPSELSSHGDGGSAAKFRRGNEEKIDSKHDGSSSSNGSGAAARPKQIVAIKKIRLRDSKEGLSMEAIREIKLLQELKHPNIMPIYEVFNYKSNIHLVLEFMEFDLEQVIKAKDVLLTPAHIKSYMRMLLLAVDHCHKNWVLHRDIKPGNLLISNDGQLKLADFGLAKIYGSPDRNLSPQACTLWYRAPEMLFGAKAYGTGADMWSVGCIFGELLLRAPLFPGTSELDQLGKIFALLGTPEEKDWPDMESLPSFTPFQKSERKNLKEVFPTATEDALDLLSRILTYSPSNRPTAAQALQHKYFSTAPLPTPPQDLPRPKGKQQQQSQSQSQTHSHAAGAGAGSSSAAADKSGDRMEDV